MTTRGKEIKYRFITLYSMVKRIEEFRLHDAIGSKS